MAVKNKLPVIPKNKSLVVSAKLPCKSVERAHDKTNSKNSQNTATVHVAVTMRTLAKSRLGGAPVVTSEAATNALLKKYAIETPPKKCMGMSIVGYVSYS